MRSWLGVAGFYATSFTVLAVFMTFFPLWLRNERGVAEQEVAWVWSAQTVARMFAGPLWSQRVDRTGRTRQTLTILSLGSCLAFAGMWTAHSVLALMLWAFVFGCCYPPIHSIHDALALRTGRLAGFGFSRVRAVGSLAFLTAVLLAGLWLDVASDATIYWLLAGALVVMTLSCAGLPSDDAFPEPPDADEPAATGAGRSPVLQLLGNRPFVLLLVSAGLIQGSHAVYYNFSAIHWQDHGIAESMTGVLWAEGVLAEVVLFVWLRGGVERLRPTTLLVTGGVLAAVRWALLGSTVELSLLLCSNWLHAFSFGCTFLGTLGAIERRVPRRQRATAQGLHGAASMGGGIVLAALLGGYLFERSPAIAFYAMGCLAFAGAVLALLLRRSANIAIPPQTTATTRPE